MGVIPLNQRKFWTDLEKGNAMRSKLIVTLLVLTLLSLAACGRDRNATGDTATVESAPAETVSTVETEAPSAEESQPVGNRYADGRACRRGAADHAVAALFHRRRKPAGCAAGSRWPDNDRN